MPMCPHSAGKTVKRSDRDMRTVCSPGLADCTVLLVPVAQTGSERLSNTSESTQLAFALRSDSKTLCRLLCAMTSAQVSPQCSLRKRKRMVTC